MDATGKEKTRNSITQNIKSEPCFLQIKETFDMSNLN